MLTDKYYLIINNSCSMKAYGKLILASSIVRPILKSHEYETIVNDFSRLNVKLLFLGKAVTDKCEYDELCYITSLYEFIQTLDQKTESHHILYLSDGLFKEGFSLVDDVAEKIRNFSNIDIIPVAVGPDADLNILKNLSRYDRVFTLVDFELAVKYFANMSLLKHTQQNFYFDCSISNLSLEYAKEYKTPISTTLKKGDDTKQNSSLQRPSASSYKADVKTNNKVRANQDIELEIPSPVLPQIQKKIISEDSNLLNEFLPFSSQEVDEEQSISNIVSDKTDVKTNNKVRANQDIELEIPSPVLPQIQKKIIFEDSNLLNEFLPFSSQEVDEEQNQQVENTTSHLDPEQSISNTVSDKTDVKTNNKVRANQDIELEVPSPVLPQIQKKIVFEDSNLLNEFLPFTSQEVEEEQNQQVENTTSHLEQEQSISKTVSHDTTAQNNIIIRGDSSLSLEEQQNSKQQNQAHSQVTKQNSNSGQVSNNISKASNIKTFIDFKDLSSVIYRLETGTYYGSCKGLSHIRYKINNQDYCNYFQKESFWALVLSDGVGSCPLSDRGAKIACKAAIDATQYMIDNKITSLQNMFVYLFKQWKADVLSDLEIIKKDDNFVLPNFYRDKTCKEKLDLDSYACTLLLAFGFRGKFFVLQLGDGVIALVDNNNKLKTFGNSFEHGRFTNCLCSYTAFKDLHCCHEVYKNDDYKSLMLITDGLQDVFNNNTEDFAQIFFNTDNLTNPIKVHELTEQLSDKTLSFMPQDDLSFALKVF